MTQENQTPELLPIDAAMQEAYLAADNWVIKTFPNGDGEQHPHFPMIHHAVSRYVELMNPSPERAEPVSLETIKGILMLCWHTENPQTFGEAMDSAATAIHAHLSQQSTQITQGGRE